MSVAAVLAGERGWHVETAHVLDGLRQLPDGCVQCVVTSPPYWGLRAYSTEPQAWGGVADCAHEWETRRRPIMTGGSGTASAKQVSNTGSQMAQEPWEQGSCARCGCWRGELGSEPTPTAFVAHLVAVFAEVKRVLRDDGTCWLNIGDSYASGEVGRVDAGRTNDPACGANEKWLNQPPRAERRRKQETGVPAKSLCLIPERLALALQDDGWIIRSRICWAKMAPMPESVRDRPTSAWEHIWLLSKAPRYFYDADAVRQPNSRADEVWPSGGAVKALLASDTDRNDWGRGITQNPAGANLRNYWVLPPEPFPAAHFAVFPTEIPRRCILAGSREGDVVLDPFAGAGTTGLVARRLNRRFIGLELNPSYVELARDRITNDAPLLETTCLDNEDWQQAPLWSGTNGTASRDSLAHGYASSDEE